MQGFDLPTRIQSVTLVTAQSEPPSDSESVTEPQPSRLGACQRRSLPARESYRDNITTALQSCYNSVTVRSTCRLRRKMRLSFANRLLSPESDCSTRSWPGGAWWLLGVTCSGLPVILAENFRVETPDIKE